jgi:hypothetical protein
VALHLLVRWSTPLDNAAINMRGYVPPVGPVLDTVPWPEVLVTMARSTDGASLELMLRPGPTPAAHPVQLGFSALAAGSTYRLCGDGVECTVVAGDDHRATVELTVDRPLRLHLEPLAARGPAEGQG